MYLDTFKEIYKDKDLYQKAWLLAENVEREIRNEYTSSDYLRNENKEAYQYYTQERIAMEDRVEWLLTSIYEDLEEIKRKERKYNVQRRRKNSKNPYAKGRNHAGRSTRLN